MTFNKVLLTCLALNGGPVCAQALSTNQTQMMSTNQTMISTNTSATIQTANTTTAPATILNGVILMPAGVPTNALTPFSQPWVMPATTNDPQNRAMGTTPRADNPIE